MRPQFFTATALLLAACFAAAAADAGQHAQHGSAAATAPTGKVIPLKPAPPGPLPPLPEGFVPVQPMPVIRQVYEFAARHPEVLQYVPCYCGCERSGHNGNHDCFVKSRAANGRIAQWDPHGIGCAICLGVGRRAMVLFNEHKSVTEIRAAIDKEFGSRYQTQTPTPRPPAAKKG